MTNEPMISDAEVGAFKDAADAEGLKDYRVRQALAAFLAARVPAPVYAMATIDAVGTTWVPQKHSWNACREAVFNGRTEGTK